MAYNGVVRTFFRDCVFALHDLVNDELRLALYENRNILTPDLEAYTPDGEVVGQNYPLGGLQIFVTDGWPRMSNDYVMECRFDPVRFTSLTGIVGGALIYNATSNRAIRCIDFGQQNFITNSDFNVEFPSTSEPALFVKLPLR